jgi:hypothetical protein
MGVHTSLGGVLFALAHLCVLHLTALTPSTYVFVSLTNDMHTIGLALDLLPFFGDCKRSVEH